VLPQAVRAGFTKGLQLVSVKPWYTKQSYSKVDDQDSNLRMEVRRDETNLQRAGIRPSTFPAGMKVTMTGRPMKDGQPAAIWCWR
jgi:hypothetical protein